MINPTLRGNPSNTRSTWNLFVPQHALPNFLDRYNREVERICAEEHVRVIKPAPAAQWTSADFFDECHFTPSGSAKFASSLQKEVARVCRT